MTFSDLGLTPQLQRAVADMDFSHPMPVQEAVIPLLLGERKDIVALAQTGTGKTAAFGLPLIQNIDPSKSLPQALILAPTRELCVQISRDLIQYAKYIPEVLITAVYGGAGIEEQIRKIQKGTHILVATPGRLLDLMRRNVVHLSTVSEVVLDEADQMLDMGFQEDLEAILSEVPGERHLMLFSATMPQEIREISKLYLHEPEEVVIGNRNATNENIRHQYFLVQAKDKYLALKRICDYYPDIYGIVFCRTRKDTQEIADLLIQDGYNADALHGDLSQSQREYVMQKFRHRGIQLLVATDVAARGLDVQNLTHVIHYALPEDAEIYTHRSGRTARAGKSGLSIAICHIREQSRLRLIEKTAGVDFEYRKLPTGSEICEKQIFKMVDEIENTIPDDNVIAPLMSVVSKRLSWLDREELLSRFLYTQMSELLHYYEQAAVVEDISPKQKREKKERHKGSSEGFTRLEINFGRRDRIYPNTLIDILNRSLGHFVEVGKIVIQERRTVFEVKSEDSEEVAGVLRDFEINGKAIKVSNVKESEVVTEDFAKRGRKKGNDKSSKHKSKSKGNEKRLGIPKKKHKDRY